MDKYNIIRPDCDTKEWDILHAPEMYKQVTLNLETHWQSNYHRSHNSVKDQVYTAYYFHLFILSVFPTSSEDTYRLRHICVADCGLLLCRAPLNLLRNEK